MGTGFFYLLHFLFSLPFGHQGTSSQTQDYEILLTGPMTVIWVVHPTAKIIMDKGQYCDA